VHALGPRRCWRAGGDTAEEVRHARGDLAGAIGDDIGPARRLVIGEHVTRRAGQAFGGAGRDVSGQTARTGDHQQAIAHISELRRIESGRHAEHDAGEAVGVR